MEKVPGFFVGTAHTLLEFIVVTKESRESIPMPKQRDFVRVCVRYGLDPEPLLELVRNRNKYVHTILLDVDKYKEAQSGE